MFRVVRLIVLVQDGRFRIAAHALGAHFVNGETRRRDLLFHGYVLRAGGGEHFRSLHGDVLGHGELVFAPAAVDFQCGDAPSVEFFLVHLDVIIVIGQAFAESADSQTPRPGHAKHVFEIRAEADFVDAAGPAFAAPAALVAVTAQKISLLGLYVSKARNVNAVGAIAERHFVFVAGHFAAGAASHVVIHEVVAEFAAGVGEAAGKFESRGIEEHARGLEGRAANKKDAGLEFESAFGLRVNDANAADAAGIRIEDQAVHDAVRADGEAAGFLRGGKRRIEAAEIGTRDAAAMANAAIVAGGASLVDAREHGRTADGQHAIIKIFGERVLQVQFNAGHFHRREKFPVGQLRQTFGLAADAGDLFHVVVPGSDVRVANGPIDGDSLFQIGFEIEIAPAIALASPGDGLSANLAPTNPGEVLSRFEGVRIVLVADKKLVGVFVASVIALTLDGLSALALGAIVPAAVLEFPHGNVLDIIALGDDAATRFEDEGVQALFGELLRSPAAGDSRTNNNCIVGCGGHGCLYPSASPAPGPALIQPCCAPGMICNLSS